MTASPWQLLPEWHPQLGVLLAWPHAGTDWQHQLAQAQRTYLDLIAAITRRQPLWLLVPNAQVKAQFLECWHHYSGHAPPEALALITAPYNDTWLRDTGPLSLGSATAHASHMPTETEQQQPTSETSNHRLKLLCFRFNGWGVKFDHDLDSVLSEKLAAARAFNHPILDDAEFEQVSHISEGGNLETNGAGVLLTQSQCLLHDNRNQGLSKTDWENIVREKLGLQRVWWLDHGQIEGDDTDGHIDTLARFCSPNHIVYQACDETTYPFADSLSAMAKQLTAWTTDPDYHVDGQPLQLTPLPWPDPVYNDQGERLPATYANYLVINGAVLVPTYGVPQDEQALRILANCYPDRTIEGIPCRSLVWQGGSLHCITMQISAPYA